MARIEYTGLRQIAVAFRELEAEAYAELAGALREVGELVRDDARERFKSYSPASAAGFEARVRPGAEALVVVGQRLTKTTGLRPDWGATQMVKGLLPARAEKLEEASLIAEERIGASLARHGL